MSENYRSLYSVIPARVRDDHSLRPNAKLLYGELSALSQAEGYCWASNAYLAERLGIAAKTVEGLLKQLKDREHIYLDVERDEETNEVLRRKIWICGPPGSSVPPPLKNEGRSPQNCGDPPLKNEGENNININNTSNIPPYSPPQGGRAVKKTGSRKPKALPAWQPEKFEGFWKAYPRDENRAKAVEQWDKLPQDKDLMGRCGGSEDTLLLEISRGLKRHLESREWRENVGIPHAFRWLRDRRWTEKSKRPPAPPAAPAALPVPSAPRRCHTEIINGEEVVIYDESS